MQRMNAFEEFEIGKYASAPCYMLCIFAFMTVFYTIQVKGGKSSGWERRGWKKSRWDIGEIVMMEGDIIDWGSGYGFTAL